MTGIAKAEKVCAELRHAMHVGDCATIERKLNDVLRSPDTPAKSYIRGYWMASRRFSSRNGINDATILRHTAVDGWVCFHVDADN